MTAKPSLPDQSPTMAELRRYFEIAAKDIDNFAGLLEHSMAARRQAREKFSAITLALAASEREKQEALGEVDARWIIQSADEQDKFDLKARAETAEARLAEVERERNEAYRQNPILREQVRELQESMAVLDEAYRAVTEQLSRAATLQATAEVERDALREQTGRLAAALGTICQMEGQEGMTDAQFAKDALGIAAGALASEALSGSPSPEVHRQRVVIVCDGERWYTRHLRVIEHDLERDEKVYRCDKPIGNDFETLSDALTSLRKAEER